MTGRRLPREFTPNEITALLEEKRRSGTRIVDLTETNPARAGLTGAGPDELQALAAAGGAAYEPDPRGARPAREAVARYYEERGAAGGTRGARLRPDDLVLVASTSEAYAHLFRLLCDPGDEVLVPRPSYPLLGPLAALEDVRIERYRLAYHDRWQLDLDSLEAAISPRTRGVVVVQPNNPTGSTLSAAEIGSVESICAERGIAIISDEVFGDFPWPPAVAPLPSLAGEPRALTFVLSGLSKLCGMPQMKLAWVGVLGPASQREDAMRRLEWIADLFLSVSTPVQLALPKLLGARHRFQASVWKRIEANLGQLRALGSANPAFRVLGAEGGWSAVLATPTSSEDFALEALAKQDVFIHPGHFYDIAQEGFAVVSLITEPGVFKEGLRRLGRLA